MRNIVHTDQLPFFGEHLPLVSHDEHLGHTLHEDGTMDLDARRKRRDYIDKTSEIRKTFHFAHPHQIMKEAQVYTSYAYGYFKSWNTFVELAWDVPQETFTHIAKMS